MLKVPTAVPDGWFSGTLLAESAMLVGAEFEVFSSTLRVESLALATARSGLPSPLKSPTATEEGPPPAAKLTAGLKEPLPMPSSTLMVESLALATARSCAAVAIEVSHDHGAKAGCSGVEVDGVLEGAVAVAQQHADIASAEVGRGKVWACRRH